MIEVTQDWFEEWAIGDPDVAFQRFCEWRSRARRTDVEARLRKALEYAAELSRPAIGFYRSERQRHKLSRRTVAQLDAMAASLESDRGPRLALRRRLGRRRGPVRVALLTEVERLPNVRFHFDVWRGLVRAARAHRTDLATHEILDERKVEDTARVLRIYDPDAVIYLRLTPSAECLTQLHAAGVAAVLIHADEHRGEKAPYPILANIVPDQSRIGRALQGLVLSYLDELDSRSAGIRKRATKSGGRPSPGRRAPRGRRPGSAEPTAVIAAMDADPGSIRHERVQRLEEGLLSVKRLHVERVRVPEYGFRHARFVLERWPDALVYCCLSDELAVGVRHLLRARRAAGETGEDRADPPQEPLIVGFDDSQVARDEGITSFGQNLDDIGRSALDAISSWVSDERGDVDRIRFRRIESEVLLATRG